jgi:hypothetical protein
LNPVMATPEGLQPAHPLAEPLLTDCSPRP